MKRAMTPHRAACESLAAHLATQGYRAWVEIRRVGVWTYGDAGRADVIALLPWAGKRSFEMVAFEVKVSRSDMLQDARAGKWRRYAEEYGIPRVAFALAGDLGDVDRELSPDVGLWYRDDKGAWKRKRAGNALAFDQTKIDPLLLLALLSQQPYHPRDEALARRFSALRTACPPEVVQAIEAIPNKKLAAHLRGRVEYSGGRHVGTSVLRRLEREPADAVAVHAWADAVIALCADVDGGDPDDMRNQIIQRGRALAGGEPLFGSGTRVERALRYAARLQRHRRDLERVVSGLGALFDRFSYDRAERFGIGLESLSAIETRDREADEDERTAHQSGSKRKRGAA